MESTNKVTPRILAGFMELLPADQIVFNRFLAIIRETYEEFGFIPQETPLIEAAEILTSKSGGIPRNRYTNLKKETMIWR